MRQESAIPVPAQEWRAAPDAARIAELLDESARVVKEAVRRRIDEGRGLDVDFAHPIQLVHFLIFHEGYITGRSGSRSRRRGSRSRTMRSARSFGMSGGRGDEGVVPGSAFYTNRR